MSSHNPLRPKSSLLEQKAKSRSGLQMVMIIVAVHVVFLGGLLFSGCRPDKAPPATAVETNSIPSLPPIGGEMAATPADTNTVTVVEPPGQAAPPLPETTTTGDDPKPPPVTRDPEPADDIVPLVPEPSSGPEVAVASGETEYIVAKGDNFTTIARKHGVTIQAVIKANPAVAPTRMAIGQVLIIPAKPQEPAKPALSEGTTEYIVKSGDNLTSIAKAHNTTWQAIREVNNLNTTAIRVGQKLIIPPPASEE